MRKCVKRIFANSYMRECIFFAHIHDLTYKLILFIFFIGEASHTDLNEISDNLSKNHYQNRGGYEFR